METREYTPSELVRTLREKQNKQLFLRGRFLAREIAWTAGNRSIFGVFALAGMRIGLTVGAIDIVLTKSRLPK